MSLSSRTPTTAASNEFIKEVWSNRVVEAAKDNLVCWDAFDTSWETELKKGDILNIAKINTVTATEVTVGSKASALNPFNTSAGTITINQWYEAPVDIDTMSILQTHIDMEGQAANEAAYAVKVNMDSYVASLFSSCNAGTAAVYGSDGQTLTDDILLDLLETLMENDIPQDDRLELVLDPSGLVDIMKIDKFISQQYGTVGPVKNGKIGKSPIYNCMVRVTNNLTATTTGAYGIMAHRTALGGAAQILPEYVWREWYKELHQIRFQAEVLYGASEIRDAWGYCFYTRKS